MPRVKKILEHIGSKGFDDIFNKSVVIPAKEHIRNMKMESMKREEGNLKENLGTLQKKIKNLDQDKR